MGHPFFDLPAPAAIGHRGCAGEAPENTLPSFERALADGAAVLESDVQLTRDGVPVLIHDDAVDRTTEGRGPVAELSWPELRRLDAGYRFSPDGGRSHPYRGRGIRVPGLEESLQAFPGARFNLELKAFRPGLVECAVDAVARAGREALTLLTAADDALMDELRGHLARCGARPAVGACRRDVVDFVRSVQEDSPPPPGPMALQVPAEFAGAPLVTAAFVAHAHRHGLPVHVWTVNEPAEMARLLDLGVDGLVTDHPARLRALLVQRER